VRRCGTRRAPSPRVRTLVLLLALCASAVAAPTARVERQTHVSASGTHELTVILPPGYDAKKRYPVLYMLDGQNLVEHPTHPGGWRAAEGVQHAVEHGGKPMIIVGVHAKDRMNEYTPFVDAEEGGGHAQQLLDYIGKELVPHIESKYRTKPSERAIGGSSLGGLFAMHALDRRPDLFSRALVFSPSVWWADKALLGEVASANVAGKRIVLYNGGDADGRANSEQLRDLLASKGARFGHELFHWTEPSAGHDEGAWASFFPRGLELLYPKL
jgi:predicted alpha/beta superfamily hydrolase